MKMADIKVGGQYVTIVSGHKTRVQVTGTRIGHSNRTVYQVIRVDNGKQLSSRDCMALHPCKTPSVTPTDETA